MTPCQIFARLAVEFLRIKARVIHKDEGQV